MIWIFFWGLDCSTQSFTAIIINYNLNQIVHKEIVNFDEDLPHYRTKNGVIALENEKIVHSYPCMWIEAIDLLFSRIKKIGFRFNKVIAISGSGQQHGTVYLNKAFEIKLQSLDSTKPLVSQLRETFSRQTSPIWILVHLNNVKKFVIHLEVWWKQSK